MFQAKFDQAKYLTLGVGAVNLTFTLVAVSTNQVLILYIAVQCVFECETILFIIFNRLLNIISKSAVPYFVDFVTESMKFCHYFFMNGLTAWTTKGIVLHFNTSVLFFPLQFFLMERAGRRRLLLTGFISIAVCNLIMTVVDSVLVKSSMCGCFHLCRKKLCAGFECVSNFCKPWNPILWHD